jgi:hypothetical protein
VASLIKLYKEMSLYFKRVLLQHNYIYTVTTLASDITRAATSSVTMTGAGGVTTTNDEERPKFN